MLGDTFIGINLIVEDRNSITSSTVNAYKKRVEEEFQSLVSSANNLWELESVKNISNYSLTVESRRVEGKFEKFNQPGKLKFQLFET